MTPGILVPVFCITFVLGLISLICQIYVSRQLSKTGTKVGLPIGRRSWITPFVMGWQYSKQLEIVDVMVFWSIILGMTFIGMIVTVFALLAAAPA
jgi:hypothetical protein